MSILKYKTILFSILLVVLISFISVSFVGCGSSSAVESSDDDTADDDSAADDDDASATTITDAMGNEIDVSGWLATCLISDDVGSPVTAELQGTFDDQPYRPSTLSMTIDDGFISTIDSETCDYEVLGDTPFATEWYDAICHLDIQCGGYDARYFIDIDNDKWTLSQFDKYNSSMNWWTFGTANYPGAGGGSGDACSSCLSACSGMPACCTGVGCICEDRC